MLCVLRSKHERLLRWSGELRSRGEAVTAHDLADGGRVRWGLRLHGGLHDSSHFVEVLRAENSWGDDGERARRGGVQVVEAVRDSARDEERGAGRDHMYLGCAAGGEQSHRESAFEAVDGLVVGVVAVGGGNPGSGSDLELEHGERGAGRGAVDVEAKIELAEAEFFRSAGGHRVRGVLSIWSGMRRILADGFSARGMRVGRQATRPSRLSTRSYAMIQ